MKEKQGDQRKRVYGFYLENRSKGSKYTVDHFFKEIMPRRGIYYIIERAELDSGYKRVAWSGRVAKIMTKKNIRVLKPMFDHKDKVSQRQVYLEN